MRSRAHISRHSNMPAPRVNGFQLKDGTIFDLDGDVQAQLTKYIEDGKDVNQRCKVREIPLLMRMVTANRPEGVNILLEAGASLDIQAKGKTAFMLSEHLELQECSQLLRAAESKAAQLADEARARADRCAAELLADEASISARSSGKQGSTRHRKARRAAARAGTSAGTTEQAPSPVSIMEPTTLDGASGGRPSETYPAPSIQGIASSSAPAAASQAEVPLMKFPSITTEVEDESKLCVICLAVEKTHALAPCGHKCLCCACADMVMRTSRLCPICREETLIAMKIFE